MPVGGPLLAGAQRPHARLPQIFQQLNDDRQEKNLEAFRMARPNSGASSARFSPFSRPLCFFSRHIYGVTHNCKHLPKAYSEPTLVNKSLDIKHAKWELVYNIKRFAAADQRKTSNNRFRYNWIDKCRQKRHQIGSVARNPADMYAFIVRRQQKKSKNATNQLCASITTVERLSLLCDQISENRLPHFMCAPASSLIALIPLQIVFVHATYASCVLWLYHWHDCSGGIFGPTIFIRPNRWTCPYPFCSCTRSISQARRRARAHTHARTHNRAHPPIQF